MLRAATVAVATIALAFAAGRAEAATTTCGTVAACVFGANTAAGDGVEGSSKSGGGVLGITTYNATASSASKSGVEGYDDSTSSKGYNVGVYGLTTYGTGVRGVSKSGVGTAGTSTTNYGVSGKSGRSIGVFGSSLSSAGVYGQSNTSDGVSGYTSTGVAVHGYSGYGPDGYSGIGVFGDSYGTVGVKALAESSEFPPAIALQAVAGDSGVTVFEGDAGLDPVVSIDAYGNMILAGTVQQKGSPYSRTLGANGSSVATFGDRISQPTLEDLGEAQLVNGKAEVALDARFGASVVPGSGYLVFLTPLGDTRGLYVSRRSSGGFTVREVGGGRSSLGFDYRIAAKPYDTPTLRMPSTNTLPQLRRTVAVKRPRAAHPQ